MTEGAPAVVEALERIEALLTINARTRVLLDRGSAATAMGMSLATFERYVQGQVPFVQIGTKILYRPADLERWSAAQVQDARPSR